MEATNKGKRWSEKEENTLKKELLEEKTFVEISNKHGRTEGGIKARVKKVLRENEIEADPNVWMKLFETEVHSMSDLGEDGARMLSEFRDKMVDISSTESTDESDSESSDSSGVIASDLENNGNRWSDEEKEQLLRELRERKSIEEIAKEHKRSLNAIKNKTEMMLCKLHATSRMNVNEISELTGMNEQGVRTMLDKYTYDTLKSVLKQLSRLSENTGIDMKLEINIRGGKIFL